MSEIIIVCFWILIAALLTAGLAMLKFKHQLPQNRNPGSSTQQQKITRIIKPEISVKLHKINIDVKDAIQEFDVFRELKVKHELELEKLRTLAYKKALDEAKEILLNVGPIIKGLYALKGEAIGEAIEPYEEPQRRFKLSKKHLPIIMLVIAGIILIAMGLRFK